MLVTSCEDVDRMKLAQERVQLCNVVDKVTTLCVP